MNFFYASCISVYYTVVNNVSDSLKFVAVAVRSIIVHLFIWKICVPPMSCLNAVVHDLVSLR